jgi:cytochrome oxidase assembly protein ShyY1
MLLRPRYIALTALMLIVALMCTGFGAWQVARLAQKSRWNAELRANAHAAAVALTPNFISTTASSVRPSSHRIQFHTVTATGSYLSGHDQVVQEATVNNNAGFYVLSPFQTGGGILLVVRGFIAVPVESLFVPSAPAAPSGVTTIQARIQPGETRNDGATELSHAQVESINPSEQAITLAAPVYHAYGELLPGNPGVGSLTPIPPPDLSNPAGGAIEPQHVAYIIQWFLFAMLALAAPIAMVRAEQRHERDDAAARTDALAEFDTADPATAGTATDALTQAKLTERYGRAR